MESAGAAPVEGENPARSPLILHLIFSGTDYALDLALIKPSGLEAKLNISPSGNRFGVVVPSCI